MSSNLKAFHSGIRSYSILS